MRILNLLVLCFLTLTSINVKCSDDVSPLIRRAYYDVLGVFPCYTEIEWLCVYSSEKSYEVAIDWLVDHPANKWNIPKEYMKILLLSNEYKNQKKVVIPEEEVYKNLFYIVGNKSLPITKENILLSSVKLIRYALKSTDNPLDAIDYITNNLISRSTSLEEANKLMSFYKKIEGTKPEIDVWLLVFNEILKIEDIRLK
jgi:hypothetical protein